jgi:CBS-domain-containing membrane protein
MTRDVRICRPDDELKEAEGKMSSARKSRLVVADDEGHCVGVISLSDIAQADSRRRAGGVLRAVTRREAPADQTALS